MRLSRLATWQKLVLLALPCFLAAAIPAALHIDTLNERAARSAREAEGARSARPLLEFIRLAQQHRGLSNGVLSGNQALAAPRDAKKAEAAAAAARLRAAVPAAAPQLAKGVTELAVSFDAIASAVDARSLDARESFRRHTELIAGAMVQLGSWLDWHGLTFEEDAATHFLVNATYVELPALTEVSGQARAMGTAILTARSSSQQDRAFAAGLIDRARERLAGMRGAVEKAVELRPGLREALGVPMRQVAEDTQRTLEVAQREVVAADSATYSPSEYFALTTRTIDAQFGLLDSLTAEMVGALEARATASARARDATLLGAMVVLLLVGAFTFALARAITRPLSQAVAVAGRIAAGRLDNTIVPEGRDEVAELLAALSNMQGQLVQVVERIQDASAAVREAAAQTAAGNTDLSSRTEEQASSLEETAANMEELTTTVRQNAGHAEAAIGLAHEALERARNGGELVSRMVGTMGSIADGSRRVREITETIDAIAFQTNLLALNAAVEAARAGEHGRGFAVVASEVRSLAQRCASASADIRGLIKASVEQVDDGRRQADVAGEAMESIVAAVRKVAERVQDIASASTQQRDGIEQVSQAVVQMEGVTQQNAALVEQAAAASIALQQQASALVEVAARFETGRGVAQAPAARIVANDRRVAMAREARPAPALPRGEEGWQSF